MNTELHIVNFEKFFENLENMPEDKAYILPFGTFGVITKGTEFSTCKKLIMTDGLLERFVDMGKTTGDKLLSELNETISKNPDRHFSYNRCMPNGNMNSKGMSYGSLPCTPQVIKDYYNETMAGYYFEGGLELKEDCLSLFKHGASNPDDRVMCYFIVDKNKAFETLNVCVDEVDYGNWNDELFKRFELLNPKTVETDEGYSVYVIEELKKQGITIISE